MITVESYELITCYEAKEMLRNDDSVSIGIDMHKGGEILTIRLEDNIYTLSVKVDHEQPVERRDFALVITCNPIPDGYVKYVGTIRKENEMLIHAFEKAPTAVKCVVDPRFKRGLS